MFRQQIRRYSTKNENLLKTPLYDIHLKHGATMVPYAGFAMPVLYKNQSHVESHNWTRTKCGLFDVSHMLQHELKGPGSTDFLHKITPTDLLGIEKMTGTLSVLLNEQGGVIDDCIITKHGDDKFYLVTNAGCREKDIKFIKSELSKNSVGEINHKTFEGTLLALQGPLANQILQKFTNFNLRELYFGHSAFLNLPSFTNDKTVHVARSGYTGEDGFEISITDNKLAVDFTNALLELQDFVKPIGLAARDSLRLEAGMCLYGHELNENVTPIESSLNWLISKTRRDPNQRIKFNGFPKIIRQLESPKTEVNFKRVGLTSKGPSPRDGNKIFNFDSPQEEIGTVCSGSPSPTLGGNVAQAFINKPYNKIGTKVLIEIRNKKREAIVTKMPFVETHLYRPN
ncbi:hypothetical protein PACTADRAFT_50077 [Pachysolen tannophilus NRRL Y-2460]|uniref:Aminomethyltransferase n=1 Tax=Pachysolen tannophilus NRRL Y-2460 TaxID=669874 RepID=A0A1E4TU68_PACTA|nr:hypothetical protein PACTADRAFT_50077 [Pachysolen tannophilus NRRL Y-2460]